MVPLICAYVAVMYHHFTIVTLFIDLLLVLAIQVPPKAEYEDEEKEKAIDILSLILLRVNASNDLLHGGVMIIMITAVCF